MDDYFPIDLVNTDERTIVQMDKLLGGDWIVLGRYQHRKAMPPMFMQTSSVHLAFSFLISGIQHFEYNDQQMVLRGGQGIVFVPGTVFGSGSYPVQKGELVWMIFRVPRGRALRLPGMGKGAAKQWFDHIVKPRDDSRFTLSPKAIDFLRNLVHVPPEDAPPLEMARFSARCFRTLMAIYDSMDEPLNRHISPEVNRVLTWMENNLDGGEVSADRLAGIAGLSVSRLQDRFRAEVGLTPADYFVRRRVVAAQRMLAEGHSVTAVAMEFGFSSSQYFSTAFKRYNLMSPTEWLATRQKGGGR